MRWPLRYQILFPFAGVMLAVVLGVSLLDAGLAARRTQRQIERQLADVAATLEESHFPLTDSVLAQTRGLSGAEFLLVDRQGRLRASSLEAADLSALPVESNAGNRVSLGHPLTMAGREYLHTAVNIAPRGTDTESLRLHILYPRDFLRLARWEAAYPPLVVGCLLLVLVAVIAFAIAGRLSRPIVELRRQLSRLVQGDFQPLPLPERNDELRDLIGSVNSLGDQLAQLRRVIKRSERLALLGQLSGGLAHQLRNTVTGARIAVQLHSRSCKGADRDSLDVALRQLTMTESHLQRFLTAGQPSAPRREPCRLSVVVADVAALVSPACRHRRVDLQLPDRDEGETALSADADQLRQLLLNLVLNAVEAAGPGGWVRVETPAPTSTITLRVSDSGPGVAPEVAERLFEPFVTGRPEGIGLGLAVVRQIVDAHGGTIRLLPERPTTFEVSLPADDAPHDGPHDETAALPYVATAEPVATGTSANLGDTR